MNDQGTILIVNDTPAEHSKATFTHGLCPDCIKKYYSELVDVLPGDSRKEAA